MDDFNVEEFREMLDGLTWDDLCMLIAFIQGRLRAHGNTTQQNVPEHTTKADCKRFIKTLRRYQHNADDKERERFELAIFQIRGVWMPQLVCHDRKDGCDINRLPSDFQYRWK